MFSPINASRNIKNDFIDYITTTLHFADSDYNEGFRNALLEEGAVAKGPYLDIGGSYESGKSLLDLIHEGQASSTFESLEHVPEEEKELKLERPLYKHQEESLKQINDGKSIIVTTGTGSGKTECFLIPIINYLLRQYEQGCLEDAVHAIIVYPMNALANDQLKRMRKLLKDAKYIRFGLYNGNTKHTRREALIDYHNAYNGAEPLPNEAISREEMQEQPPHILITNYSMMEYMLLRPIDDAVFQDARLRFIVLDEAHIYRGATGMETSLLLRRMHARIANKNYLQYILTSATLGGLDANEQILDFGKRLCGVDFDENSIIRSRLKQFDVNEYRDYSPEMFVELAQSGANINEILSRYDVKFDIQKTDAEKLFQVCLNSHLYKELRIAGTEPSTLPVLLEKINRIVPITEEQLEAFIEVCSRASLDGASLIKPRYHFFVRALEGAYITIGDQKLLYLNRCSSIMLDGKPKAVFEAAVCNDCGRTALTGLINPNGFLTQHSIVNGSDDADYYVIKQPEDNVWYVDEEDDDSEAEDDYIVCCTCGAIRSDNGSKNYPCEHGSQAYIRLHKAKKTAAGNCKCPACGTGDLRRFYLGNEAATAVLGTDLYEQLPDVETIEITTPSITKTNSTLFGTRKASSVVKKDIVRQFLCFSDSRSEAAYFASYMKQSYDEFLRRRGIWHVAQQLRKEGRNRVGMYEFVNNLITYFEQNRCFLDWDSKDRAAYVSAKENAWTAMLNELFNARRSTGLMSMGVFAVRYRPNDGLAESLVEHYPKTALSDMQALLEQIVMDGIYTGAINAGGDVLLTEAQREYIFFTRTPQKLVLVKNAGSSRFTSEHGWCARCRTNGNYYPNIRTNRIAKALNITEEEANGVLEAYWQNVLHPEKNTYVFDANDFDVLLDNTDKLPVYRCKKCGRVTTLNVQGNCANIKCTGTLEPFDALKASESNHYARLYRSEQTKPLYIKEHTAQLSKKQQRLYQEAFVKKQINALSCSTTFEMGVDLGSLETVYMRNVPPSPSNYVQRAGRAGRGKNSAAFVMTYSKLSSHDFTYYAQPQDLISGNIAAPVFRLENEKIIRRHIFAIALGYFFKHDTEAYGGDDRTAFLLHGGYERLKQMLEIVPAKLNDLLKSSIPAVMHKRMGITDGTWVNDMIGTGDNENDQKLGVLESAYQSFHAELRELENLRDRYHRNHEPDLELRVTRQINMMKAETKEGHQKQRLIDFLVRNNILPKYGFPVDTVELQQYGSNNVDDDNRLQLSRDLQLAIAEYAPGSEVVADGLLYKSRYIRKGFGKGNTAWEMGSYSECPTCGQFNFTKELLLRGESRECVSCHTPIPKRRWHDTIEPRRGFQIEGDGQPVPLHRPERGYKTDDYYIGDPHRNIINRQVFRINDRKIILESTANDSLVVVSRDSYYVCPRCGYASDAALPDTHKNGQGFTCEAEARDAKKYNLSHDFKTDVAKLTFIDQRASDRKRMNSVMYALLEGLSRRMDIERNDIKGCLHYTDSEVGMVLSLILYDSVPGGAGNVRRMVTDDGQAFLNVIMQSIELLQNCACDSSCYNCLRNYYNQKIHDQLDRHEALAFLKEWVGEPVPIYEDVGKSGYSPGTDFEAETTFNNEPKVECDYDYMSDYSTWKELASAFGDDASRLSYWDDVNIPYRGKFLATLKLADLEMETIVTWPEEKLSVCTADKLLSTALFAKHGWRFIDLNADPASILNAMTMR